MDTEKPFDLRSELGLPPMPEPAEAQSPEGVNEELIRNLNSGLLDRATEHKTIALILKYQDWRDADKRIRDELLREKLRLRQLLGTDDADPESHS